MWTVTSFSVYVNIILDDLRVRYHISNPKIVLGIDEIRKSDDMEKSIVNMICQTLDMTIWMLLGLQV